MINKDQDAGRTFSGKFNLAFLQDRFAIHSVQNIIKKVIESVYLPNNLTSNE